MTPPTTYQISTIKDIFSLPTLEKSLACLDELKALMEQARPMSDLQQAMAGVPLDWPDLIEWIDDGKGQVTSNFHTDEGPQFSLTTKV